MQRSFGFKDVQSSSHLGYGQLRDMPPAGAALDLGRDFMPDALAPTSIASGMVLPKSVARPDVMSPAAPEWISAATPAFS